MLFSHEEDHTDRSLVADFLNDHFQTVKGIKFRNSPQVVPNDNVVMRGRGNDNYAQHVSEDWSEVRINGHLDYNVIERQSIVFNADEMSAYWFIYSNNEMLFTLYTSDYENFQSLIVERSIGNDVTVEINSIATDTSGYILSGDVEGTNATINVVVGSTLNIIKTTTGHPLYIKTVATTGTSDTVTEGSIVGQGVTNGTLSWSTISVTPGAYYYQCANHENLSGVIIVKNSNDVTVEIHSIAEDTSGYIVTGDVEGINATIDITVGSTLYIVKSTTGHPLYIKTTQTTGTGDTVTEGTVTGQGVTNGTLSWSTIGVTPGTYYYNCANHQNLGGIINVTN
jgi:plastocyanin